MRKKFFILSPLLLLPLILLALTAIQGRQQIQQASAASPQPVGQTGNWNMIFDDEFNGTSLDLTKWKPQEDWYTGPANGVLRPVNTAETAAYDPAQNIVSGGTLQQALISKPAVVNGKTYPYRTGYIESVPFTFSYGYYEARMFIPATANGQVANWPVLWSSGPNWPTNGRR